MAQIVRLDPFQNIVNVHWADKGSVALLQLRDAYSNAGSIPNAPTINLPQLSGFPIPDVAFGLSEFHTDTTTPGPTVTITTDIYHFEVTTSSSFGQGEIHVVSSSDGTTIWFEPGGATGDGGIDAAEAFFLANGWDTFTSSLLSSETSEQPGPDAHEGSDRAIAFFDLKLIRIALAPAVNFQINVTVPLKPAAPNESGTVDFDWTCILETYKGKLADFPTVDGLPDNWHKTPIDGKTVTGSTSATTLHFVINLDTLAVTVS